MSTTRLAAEREPFTVMSDDVDEAGRWFLTAAERGNPGTVIDRRRGDDRAWTEGNRVTPLVHGAEYFVRRVAADGRGVGQLVRG